MNYWATELPTFDVMKRASSWLTQCSSGGTCSGFTGTAGTWDTQEESRLALDADGYPLSLPAATDTTVKYRKVTTVLSSTNVLPLGQYTILYDGSGKLAYGGSVSIVSTSAGRDVVNLTSTNHGSFWLTITATDPANHLRNIRVYMPGGACSNDLGTYAASAAACTTGKGSYVPFEAFPSAAGIWNPQFLADVKGFRTLRFMDWGNTNSTMVSNWSDRPSATTRVWSSGVPLEWMFDLANRVGADPWINIPAHATDDYVTQAAKLAVQTLDASRTVNMEYANEPWNYAFPATKWMLAQAQAAWPADVAAGANVYELENNWYARRLVQTCSLAKGAVAGGASRFRCIANTQAAQPTQTDQVLKCTYAARTLGQACAKYIDAVAIAPYFGYYVGNTSLRTVVDSWMSSADGGLTQLFQELTGKNATGSTAPALLASYNSGAPGGAIAQAASWMTGQQAVISTKYGLPMWAYEGGQHLLPNAGDTDTGFVNLTIAANRDPRMGAAYQQMMAAWQAAGGQTFVYYSHASTPTKTGSWGMKETMTDNDNAKWLAATAVRDSACWWSGC
ncbi:MAG TPA: hypothetical protein VF457_15455 [Burkholderiaceae bacterium]